MTVWQLISEDICAWKRTGFLGEGAKHSPLRFSEAVKLYWRFAGVRATVAYRLSHAAERHRIPLVPGILSRRNIRRYGLDIVPSVEIGPGLYIPHPVGTVIMARKIGARCSIISSVTIGMRNPPARFPIIGDDVTIGSGARILGPIAIGDNVQIGANAVVIDDIPDGSTAVGIPARLVRSKVTTV
ncbi:MAG: serine O-acetyltransferase [Ktedonobacterales bacterium]